MPYTLNDVLSEVAGLTVRVLRYYRNAGIFPAARSSDSNGRNYDDEHIRVAREIARFRGDYPRGPLSILRTRLAPHPDDDDPNAPAFAFVRAAR